MLMIYLPTVYNMQIISIHSFSRSSQRLKEGRGVLGSILCLQGIAQLNT